MKLKVTLVLAPILALLFAAVAVAKTDNGTAAAAAKAATITCGTEAERSGVAAPIDRSGLRRSVRSSSDWAQYYVRRVEQAVKANAKQEDHASSRATRSWVSTRRSPGPGRAVVRLEPERCSASSDQAGGQEVVASTSALQGREGSGYCDGLGDTRLAHRRHHRRRQPAEGTSIRPCRTTTSRARRSRTTSALKIKADTRVHHRRPGDVLPGPRGQRPGRPCGQRASTVTRDSVSQDTTPDFSSLIAEDSRQHRTSCTSPWQLSPRAQAFGQQLRGSGQG